MSLQTGSWITITIRIFPDKTAIQLNDTHPAIAIPEMMRILIDEKKLSFEAAWKITQRTFAYTNHTILPEAQERWSVSIFEELLPRHLMLIYQINNLLLSEVTRRYPGDLNKMRKMSVIEEGTEKNIRMAQLSIVGSHAINGVAELHTKILKETIFPDFYEMYPEKFQNKTNGITQRLWLKECNPHLARLISEHIGDGWLTDLYRIKGIEQYVDDEQFLRNFAEIKGINKKKLSKYIYKETGVRTNPDSLFDIHVKRMHEYKRQLLNVLQVIARYNRIKANPGGDFVPRTVIFAGKAAPGYFLAKKIIKLINNIGEIINKDVDVKDRLKVVFLPNYSVSLAGKIIPAADLSEQISTAGYEASGTGNMKLALNGALTIGTLDGANVEMAEEIGKENMFIFGMSAEEVVFLKQAGYNPCEYYNNDAELRQVIEMISNNYFSKDEPGIFDMIVKSLMQDGDIYCLLADFRSYMEAQDKVDELYKNPLEWTKKAIINVAGMGKFSSDRAVIQYAKEIWNIKPIHIELTNGR